MTGAPVARVRRESGTALVELTWLAILLLVPLLYIVLAVFEVQRAAFAAVSAAKSAARAYVIAPDEASAAERVDAAWRLALQDQGIVTARAEVLVTCRPDPANCLAPGSVVDVRVAYPVPLPLLPSALGEQTPSIRVEAVHSVPYGSFREDRP